MRPAQRFRDAVRGGSVPGQGRGRTGRQPRVATSARLRHTWHETQWGRARHEVLVWRPVRALFGLGLVLRHAVSQLGQTRPCVRANAPVRAGEALELSQGMCIDRHVRIRVRQRRSSQLSAGGAADYAVAHALGHHDAVSVAVVRVLECLVVAIRIRLDR